MVVLLDQTGTIRYANARTEQILGVRRSDWIGRPVFELVHPDDLALAMEILVSTQAAGSGVKEHVPYRVRKGDGSWATVEVITSNIELVDGELALALSCREITTRRPSIEIVNEASERLSRMFADAAIGMTQTGLDGRLLRVNRSFADLLGMDADELVGRSDAEFTHPDDRAGRRVADEPAGQRRPPDVPQLEALRRRRRARRARRADRLAGARPARRAALPRHPGDRRDGPGGGPGRAACTARPTTRSPAWPTGRCCSTLLDQALSRAARRNESIAVLFLDLDGFKVVNDTHGHSAGDALLVQVAERLVGTVRSGDVVSRFGGDEFVVMCENADEDAVGDIARRIIDALAVPFELGAVTATIGVSVGLAIEPAATVSAEDLLNHADAALYDAKGRGRGRVQRHLASTADRRPASAGVGDLDGDGVAEERAVAGDRLQPVVRAPRSSTPTSATSDPVGTAQRPVRGVALVRAVRRRRRRDQQLGADVVGREVPAVGQPGLGHARPGATTSATTTSPTRTVTVRLDGRASTRWYGSRRWPWTSSSSSNQRSRRSQ